MTGLVTDPLFFEHRPPGEHPERPERLHAILQTLQPLPQLHAITPRDATPEEIAAVHPDPYYGLLEKSVAKAPAMIDADTYVAKRSLDAAKRACGAVLAGIDAVFSGVCRNAFCAVRPPGHHAESARAMGFCLINNIAAGARYAKKRHGVDRVMIIDWDVHHGNGTQEIFYEDPSVFYFSVHESPLYPGTGKRSETGSGAGEGTTCNVPLLAGSGDDVYHRVFENVLDPIVRSWKPELILVSAGFDAHERDPLAHMTVSTDGFGMLTRTLTVWAEEVCQGRLVSVLEGGYDLEALGASVAAHVGVLADA